MHKQFDQLRATVYIALHFMQYIVHCNAFTKNIAMHWIEEVEERNAQTIWSIANDCQFKEGLQSLQPFMVIMMHHTHSLSMMTTMLTMMMTTMTMMKLKVMTTTGMTMTLIRVAQVAQSCKPGCEDLSNFWGFLRIFVVSKGENEASHRRWNGCPQSSILNLQCSILSPQSSEMPKNNVFAPKNLIYGILVANVARISTCALWG